MQLKLRTKILLPVGLTLAGIIALLYPAAAYLLSSGFERVEQENGRRDVNRVRGALTDLLDQIKSKIADWAMWDKTYQFVDDPRPFIEGDLPSAKTLANLRIDVIICVNRGGKVMLHSQLTNAVTQPALEESPLTWLADPQNGLLAHKDLESAITGLFMTPRGPLAVCSRPIRHTDGTGPINGTLIFGRFLDEDVIKELSERTQLQVELIPVAATATRPALAAILPQLADPRATVVRPLGTDQLAGYTVLDDLHGRPLLLVQVAMPRQGYLQGIATLHSMLLLLVAVGVAAEVSITLLLEKLVIGQLKRLSEEVQRIGASPDLTERLPVFSQDELGATVRRLNTMLDHRMAAVQELKKLAMVAARTKNAVIVTDEHHCVEWVNQGFTRMTGYTLEDMSGKTPGSMLQGDETDRATVDYMRRELQAGRSFTAELVNYSKTGRKFWVAIEIQPVHDEQGRLRNFMSIESDITERKQAQEALADLNTQMRDVLDSATMVSIVATDEQGVITLFNPGAEVMLGYNAAEMVGEDTPLTLHDPAEIKARSEVLSRELGRPVTGFDVLREEARRSRHEEREWLYRTKDGSLLSVTLGANELHDPAGRVTGYLFLAKDITERKKALAQLLEAKQVAEGANRAKSEFLANMSHEIRTPMNGIMGMTELALNTELTPEQREYLELVKRSADTLLVLLNDILDFSKVEAGRLELDHINFHLRNVMAETMKTLAVQAHKKGLELLCRVQPEVPNHLVGDSLRLRQILVNLVTNAIKFTSKGEVEVTVKREDAPEGQTHLHFAVRDTGIGIPAGKAKIIFEAFTQADSSITRQYGGTGLGLAISSRLVHMMGGKIWVESEPGRGSTFHFVAVFARQPKNAAGGASSTGFQMPDVFNMPVLVVDDNEVNRRILVEMLKNWHMDPTAVADGPAALEEIRNAQKQGVPFQLILLDADMPVMSGFDLAAEIKKIPQLARGTVMMLSSADRRGEIAQCKELGIARHLVKPVSQSDLWNAIISTVALSRPVTIAPLPKRLEMPPPAVEALKILLAEDNDINQKLAVRMLEKMGHRVRVAETGEEVLQILDAEPIDLVLMDVQMPIMDGFTATQAIRQKEKVGKTRLPIIAMTAHALKGDRERCLTAGMDGYIAKPIMPKSLADEIEIVLKKVRLRNPPADQ